MNTFENIMGSGAFAPKEQMLYFPLYFQMHDISKALLWSKGLKTKGSQLHIKHLKILSALIICCLAF